MTFALEAIHLQSGRGGVNDSCFDCKCEGLLHEDLVAYERFGTGEGQTEAPLNEKSENDTCYQVRVSKSLQ